MRKDTTTGFKKQHERKQNSQMTSPRVTDGNMTQTIPTKKKKRAEIHRRSVFDAYIEMKRENFHGISLPEFELRDETRARRGMKQSNFKAVASSVKHKLSLKERVELKEKMRNT